MRDLIEKLINELHQKNSDTREHLFNVQLGEINGKQAAISGQVLSKSDFDTLAKALLKALPAVDINLEGVKVLRVNEPRMMAVGRNLISLHAEPSWLAEQLTQMAYSTRVEILEEQDSWVYVRCADGYLGWTYLPYLTADMLPPATHLVISPVSQLLVEPKDRAAVVTRVLGGTFVHLLGLQGEWARIQANAEGWLRMDDLRNLQTLPVTTVQRREQMVEDAFRMVGVPYLWGGTSANGIDCSGFAQLVHRWSGMTLRRDADMQMADGKPVKPEQLQPGDLVFFGDSDDRRAVTHVGISLGGWDIIHSSRSRHGVYTDNIKKVNGLRESFLGAATYLG